MAGIDEALITKLNEIHQEKYANSVERLLPDNTKLLKAIPFSKGGEGDGPEYRQPCLLSDELGFSTGEDAFEYNPPVPSNRKKAKIKGFDIALTSAMSISDAKLSVQDEKNYAENGGDIIKTMKLSFAKLLEILHMYGQDADGLAKIASVDVSESNNKQAEITFADRFAPAMWSGYENLKLDVFAGINRVNGEKKPLIIKTVKASEGKIIVTSKTEDLNFLSQGQTLHYYGFRDYEPVGMRNILSSSGQELFGISGADYSIWNANPFNANGKPLTMSMILNATASAVDRGLEEDVEVFVNVQHWNQLQDQLMAQRVFDSSYKKERTDIGSRAITYYGNNGMISIIPSIYTKIGDALIFPKKRFKRIGYQDITSGVPGVDASQSVWRRMEKRHGVQTTMWTNQSIFTAHPQKTMYVSGLSDQVTDSYSVSGAGAIASNSSDISNLKSENESLSASVQNLITENNLLKQSVDAMKTRLETLENA